MPLPDPVQREPMHRREVTCEGFRRADGLWDIEGRLVDTKPFAVENHSRGEVPPGTPIHGMALRLTVDLDLEIREVAVASDSVPNPICREVEANFQALVGLRIAPGFTRAVRERLGGRSGCTHLVELVGSVATTAFQATYLAREARDSANTERSRPYIIDTCHTLRSDGPVVLRRWPQYYTGGTPGEGDAGTRD